MEKLLVLLACLALLPVAGAAQSQFGAAQREEVVKTLSSMLADRYLDEAVGRRLSQLLQDKLTRGEFDVLAQPEAFAAAITDILQAETRDRHLWIWYRSGAAARLQFAFVEAPMVGRVDVLPGHIGYIEVHHFVGQVAEFDAAMEKVKGAAALVLDLRQCAGGNREQVHHLSTYFFAKPTRLLSRQARTDQAPIEHRTLDTVPGPRFADAPVYVLTSQRTFSAAEGFALGLRVNGRALLVGERTGGGGHYVQGFPQLPHGFQMLLPVGRNLDPRTGRSWEIEGLSPDLSVNAEQALQSAIGHFHGWRRRLAP
jgi:retinol-binding protein 3